jgi:hypothetical protein
MKKMISFSTSAYGNFSHLLLPDRFSFDGAMPFNNPELI